MHGIIKDLFSGTVLHQLASIHDADRITDIGHYGDIVGNKDDAQLQFLLKVFGLLQDLMLHNDIEGCGRLIRDD